ncbi:tetratricopeptide repeat protein, partial [Bacillus cereus]|uniref:tetratricopeptide repeat protein n=1 Tax=Bacillus cereus TaxID=1396 RepID=UPI0035CC8C05
DYAFAYNNRGNALKSKGNVEEAIRDYTKAIELKSDYAFAYNNRGNALKSKGNVEEAIRDYTKAIELK